MEFEGQKVELIIIGANPSGLLLAAQLLHFGLQPLIIDSKSFSSKSSPAISLQPRTLEIFNQLGLGKELLAAGFECSGLTIQNENKVIGYLNYADFEPDTEFPFVLTVSQKKIEEILIRYLAVRACPIYWDTKLVNLKQDDKMVVAMMEKAGVVFNRACRWLVVADGFQYHQIETNVINYRHRELNRSVYQVDLQTRELHNRNMHLFLTQTGFSLATPVNEGRYDFIGSVPKGHKAPFKQKEIKQILDRSLGFSIPVESYNSVNLRSLNSKQAAAYQIQRCILIGNAAFCQSAFPGGDINMGIQDAHNLGWKLANVCNGRQSESVLHSYEGERKDLGDQSFRMNFLLLKLLFAFNTLHLKVPYLLIKRFVEKTALTGFNVHYRKSTLSFHHSLGRKIQAGDRIPFLSVYDEKKKEETDLHKWCKKSGFVLLLLGNLSSNSLFIMAQWMKQKYAQQMHLFYLPYSDKNNSVFEAFEVRPDRNKMILIRPDMHIAYIHDIVGANLIDTYMLEVMKWKF